jgi:hypothetical protein
MNKPDNFLDIEHTPVSMTSEVLRLRLYTVLDRHEVSKQIGIWNDVNVVVDAVKKVAQGVTDWTTQRLPRESQWTKTSKKEASHRNFCSFI